MTSEIHALKQNSRGKSCLSTGPVAKCRTRPPQDRDRGLAACRVTPIFLQAVVCLVAMLGHAHVGRSKYLRRHTLPVRPRQLRQRHARQQMGLCICGQGKILGWTNDPARS